MALAIYFAPAAMNVAQYNDIHARLKKAGAGQPAGRTFHACFGAPDKLMVFDIWTSQAAFDKFGKSLMPILAELGIDTGKPDVMPVQRVIMPPTKSTRSGRASSESSAPARRTAGRTPARRAAKKR